jgi:uncharacterized protein (DUF885 family)
VNDDLAHLADEYWEYGLEYEPTDALMLGDHRYDTRMEDVSRQAEDAHIARLRDFAAKAAAVDPAGLTADGRVTREVLMFLATADADFAAQRLVEVAVNPAIGVQEMLPVAVGQFPLGEAQHAEDVLAKYREMGRMFGQYAERVREGLAAGRTAVDLHIDRTVARLDAWLASPVDTDPLLAVPAPPVFDDAAEAAWRRRLAGVIAEHVRPGLARYRDAIAATRGAARSAERPGLCSLPGGDEAYAAAVRRYVTLDRDPEEVHRVGLAQIERLTAEYRELGGEVLGTTDLAEIFEALRSDPALHFTEGPAVVAAADAALAKAQAAMGDWFGRLPRAGCRVAETPSGPIAFYFPPAADGSRPGTFFVNTSDPANWGTFQIESMAFHEGIPGHHLQLAIAQELPDVPQFRRHAFISAYGEGWGLYTERLADEMGLYGGPLDRIGMLWGDSMRACRLVVDTGMHALGWSRRQAIDYVSANSPMAVGQIEAEIDRYIGMPGQALSYMLGRIEVQRLRFEAEEAMGDRFDIKGFHDVLLGSGVVPLETLGRLVREWAAGSP